MKRTYALALAACLPLAALTLNSQAQKIAAPAQEHILVTATPDAGDESRKETFSGIHLKPASKGTFQLDFSQELDENALLEIKNKAGKVVFSKPLVAARQNTWSYNVGKLLPDTYLIEVKTSDTTYWTKFRVGK